MSPVEIDATYYNYSTWLIKYVRLLPFVGFAQTREEMFGVGYHVHGWPIDHAKRSVAVKVCGETYFFDCGDPEFTLSSRDAGELKYMASRWDLNAEWLFAIIKAQNPWK